MTLEPPNTGERILLEKESPLMIARHQCAYRFAQPFVGGKRVLDIGCGEGYGSYFLAEAAQSVLGIDYNTQAVEYARSKYRKDNVRFEVVDIQHLDSVRASHEVICCFQVIEHIGDADQFLEKVKRVLTPDGLFICSTCNRLDASPGRETPHNKFHVREYLYEEFRRLLEKHFKRLQLYGLRRGKRLVFFRRLKKIGLFRYSPRCINPVTAFFDNVSCDNFVIVKENFATTLDFMAVCGK